MSDFGSMEHQMQVRETLAAAERALARDTPWEYRPAPLFMQVTCAHEYTEVVNGWPVCGRCGRTQTVLPS